MGADRQSRGAQASLQLIAEVVPLVSAWAVDKTFSYAVPSELDVSVGSLVRVPFGGRKVRGVVVAVTEGDGAELEEVLGLVVVPPIAPPPMHEVLEWVAQRYVTPRGVVFDRAVPPRVRVGAVERGPEPAFQVPDLLAGYVGGDDLLRALRGGEPGLWCLQALPTHEHGDLISELVGALESGQALVALPEVRWGSPVAERLVGCFPNAVRADSSVSDAERSAGWLALAAGHRIGVGSRSVVYAPAPDLRLLVLDDEANPTFKEDRSPRIDARRVAQRRAEHAGAICVMLADGHSMEYSLHPDVRWVAPEKGALKAASPNVEIIEQSEDGVSRELHRSIASTLRDNKRVALLAPRGGYARSLWCKDCRRSVRCPRCETGVIYERATRSARCPHCAFSGRAPDVCPTCGSTEFLYLGAGTERLEQQLGSMFPRAKVARMDPSVLAEGDEAPKIDADIYLTTWIGTKAALRPPVDLVAVLDADGLLRRPDFRAAENGYLAFVEMARWAGPASEGGHLVIQTREPMHHSIQAVVRSDHRFFVEREAEVRRDLSYPPFSELIRLRSTGPLATALMDSVRETLAGEEVSILGPITVRVGDSEVQEVLLKCVDADPISERLRGILPNVPRGSTLRVDVDPR